MAFPEDRDDYPMEARKTRLPLPEQDKALAELNEISNLLMDKLQPILTPNEPTEKMAEDRAVPMQSEIANTLTDNNARIRRVTNRLTDALQRLEV